MGTTLERPGGSATEGIRLEPTTGTLGQGPTPEPESSVYGSCKEAAEAGEQRSQGGVFSVSVSGVGFLPCWQLLLQQGIFTRLGSRNWIPAIPGYDTNRSVAIMKFVEWGGGERHRRAGPHADAGSHTHNGAHGDVQVAVDGSLKFAALVHPTAQLLFGEQPEPALTHY